MLPSVASSLGFQCPRKVIRGTFANNLPAPFASRCPLGAWLSNLSPKGGDGIGEANFWLTLWQAGSGRGAGRG